MSGEHVEPGHRVPGWGTLGLCGCGEGEANPAGGKVRQELNPASEARGGTIYPPQLLVHLCILHGDSRRVLLVQEPVVCGIPCGGSALRAGEWDQRWDQSWYQTCPLQACLKPISLQLHAYVVISPRLQACQTQSHFNPKAQ